MGEPVRPSLGDLAIVRSPSEALANQNPWLTISPRADAIVSSHTLTWRCVAEAASTECPRTTTEYNRNVTLNGHLRMQGILICRKASLVGLSPLPSGWTASPLTLPRPTKESRLRSSARPHALRRPTKENRPLQAEGSTLHTPPRPTTESRPWTHHRPHGRTTGHVTNAQMSRALWAPPFLNREAAMAVSMSEPTFFKNTNSSTRASGTGFGSSGSAP